MKKAEIAVDKTYLMNHTSGRNIKVKVLRTVERTNYGGRGASSPTRTHWVCLNLKTNREIEVKSAAKFLREAIEGIDTPR